jgi:hypothetical protein
MGKTVKNHMTVLLVQANFLVKTEELLKDKLVDVDVNARKDILEIIVRH